MGEVIDIGFVPPLWKPELINKIQTVATIDVKAMAHRLARKEGIFAGTSSGANMVAAIRIAPRLGPGAKVVKIKCDSGLCYLSTDVYRPQEAAKTRTRRRSMS